MQDDTTPHSFRHTKTLLRDAFGDDWEQNILIDENSPILGSGCIGQVYKCKLIGGGGRCGDDVALKILHPNVESGIDADLDILRFFAHVLDSFDKDLRWLNFPGMVEEFAGLLKDQLDLRNEGKNLRMFR